MNIVDGHITIKSSSAMQEICKPLKEYFNITDFLYEKVYKDNSKVKLANNPEWVRHYHLRGFHLIGDCEKSIDIIQPGYQLASTMLSQEIFQYCRDYFNIDHSIVLIDKFDDFCEFYWFASTRDNRKIVDFYLNNMDLLRRFIFYFKDKASDIIKNAENERLIIPPRVVMQDKEAIIRKKSRKDFIEATRIRNYRLKGTYSHVLFTEKEFECAVRLIMGDTAEEIANSIFKSRRTIESHMRTMKEKLRCRTKSQLINILLGNGFGVYTSNDVILV